MGSAHPSSRDAEVRRGWGGTPILIRVPPGTLTRRSPCSRAGDGRCPGDSAQPGRRGRRRDAAPPGSAAGRSVGRSSLEPPRSWRAPRSRSHSRSQPSPGDSWALPEGRRAAARSLRAGPETWGPGAGRPPSSPGAPRLSAPGLACCRPAPPSAVAPPHGARGGRCSLPAPPPPLPAAALPVPPSPRLRFFGEGPVRCGEEGTESRQRGFSRAPEPTWARTSPL